MHISNAYTIDSIDDIWKWNSHLGSTLLGQYSVLNGKLGDHCTRYMKLYHIRWCKAKCNRFFLIRCQVCGNAVYGKYPDGATEDASTSIAAIAAFMGQDPNSLVNSA